MTQRLTEMETLFKALGDVTRLRILGLLVTGEVCVCDIHETLKIPQPKASRHLAYLRRSGLVDTRRDGLWVHYRLAQANDTVMTTLTDAVRHALTHVDDVVRDIEQLQTRTSCCTPAPGDAVTAGACCTGGATPVAVARTRS